ncbi:MAG: ATP-binding cassette domain-containing protein [Christensenellales bacterium]
MLKLIDITKTYEVGDIKVEALKGINLEFRKHEFVSILGPSGCGKTTMLNIIGGLDRYTSGDLIVNGISTKEFKDRDWDTYRNHSIGFVFQSYNLISHQTVLENVELALTLSGVSKKERKQRAIDALTQVGLKDKLHAKPNQLSGGQMQRVAIARALVNDPEIILADEPTGALDTESSVQVMEILKNISKNKLIIMVTHNPELANKYSTRIVKLLDGKLVSDSKPYKSRAKKEQNKSKPKAIKRMSFFTAMFLSLKNLLTKKARTLLVAFAGSIGIIGIALVLAISNGFSTYVNKMQQETLSSYPVQLTNASYDMASLMKIFLNDNSESNKHDNDKVYTKDELTDMLSKFNTSSSQSDLKSFKQYIETDGKEELEKYTSAVQYVYNAPINAYYNSSSNGLVSANATTVFADIISGYPLTHPLDTQDKQTRYYLLNYMFGSGSSYYSNEFWSEMLDNQSLLQSQYELVGEGSRWATEYNEIMIVIDENNEISDYTLYGLGLLNQSDLENLLDNYINNRDSEPVGATFEYNDLLNLEYKIIPESDFYEKQADGTYFDIRSLRNSANVEDLTRYKTKIQDLYDNNSVTIKVAGLIKAREDASNDSIKTVIAYNSKLTKYMIDLNNNRQIIQDVLQAETTDIKALGVLGYADLSSPDGIYLYPVDFESKNKISDFITNYNNLQIASGNEDKVITYSDTIGVMMSSISTIISAITYVLIAFVGVSLVVSSIMIGIITYISVIERTKEIGILRSIGASKKDIKRVFTAESFIIGLSSGVFGIVISLLLILPINIVLKHFTGLINIATLPVLGAIILIAISILLTLIAGLFPAQIAAKKDPVIALREN